MELKGSVGRRNGRDSRNHVGDQRIVQEVLNKIPIQVGGGGGSLRERMIEGVCSDGLYAAILKFQKKNLPKFADGRIDPEGPTIDLLRRMIGFDALKTSTAALIAQGWDFVQRARRQAAVEEAGRSANWARLRAAVMGMIDNPHQAATLRYLDALAASNGQRAPVLPGHSVLVGNAHLEGKGYPAPAVGDLWEADYWNMKVVHPASYYKYRFGTVLTPTVRIEIKGDHRAILMFQDGSALDMRSGMWMTIFEDRVGYRPSTIRTSADRARLKESLKKLDAVR